MSGDLREARTTQGDEPSDGAPARPYRPWWRRRALLLFVGVPVAVALFLGTAVGVGAWQLQSNIDKKISRFADPAAQIPAAVRPQVVENGPQAPMNLLVFGSDSRISAGDPSQWQAGAQRTDAIMLVHVPADRSGVYVMSIPRDSWVSIPGHGTAKINAAYSYGGPALAIRTVEQLTGVRIDHMVITDFTGFARITDLLGGVQITVPQKTHLGNSSRTIDAGTYTMDGQTALAYVRERYSLPGGDFDREKRQQNWIRAILKSGAASGAQNDPRELLGLLDALASSLSTDSGFTIEQMRDLVLSLRHVGAGGAKFLTVPIAGTGWSPDGKQSIVNLDLPRAQSLFTAVHDDTVATWLSTNDYPTLGSRVS